MQSPKSLARVAGLVYLMVAVAAGVAGYARSTIVVSADAAATAANIRASETLFRVSIVADLLQTTFFLLTAIALYALLRHVHRLAPIAMVTFVAVSVAMQALSLVLHVAALSIATDAGFTTAFGQAGSDALAMLFTGLQHDGFVLSQMFFGLWLLPLGYLVVKSGYFPKVLGYLLVLACVGYVVDLFAYFLVPDLEPAFLPISAIAGVLGEVTFIAWLLAKGVRTPPVDAASIVDGRGGVPADHTAEGPR